MTVISCISYPGNTMTVSHFQCNPWQLRTSCNYYLTSMHLSVRAASSSQDAGIENRAKFRAGPSSE